MLDTYIRINVSADIKTHVTKALTGLLSATCNNHHQWVGIHALTPLSCLCCKHGGNSISVK